MLTMDQSNDSALGGVEREILARRAVGWSEREIAWVVPWLTRRGVLRAEKEMVDRYDLDGVEDLEFFAVESGLMLSPPRKREELRVIRKKRRRRRGLHW